MNKNVENDNNGDIITIRCKIKQLSICLGKGFICRLIC